MHGDFKHQKSRHPSTHVSTIFQVDDIYQTRASDEMVSQPPQKLQIEQHHRKFHVFAANQPCLRNQTMDGQNVRAGSVSICTGLHLEFTRLEMSTLGWSCGLDPLIGQRRQLGIKKARLRCPTKKRLRAQLKWVMESARSSHFLQLAQDPTRLGELFGSQLDPTGRSQVPWSSAMRGTIDRSIDLSLFDNVGLHLEKIFNESLGTLLVPFCCSDAITEATNGRLDHPS